MCDHVAKCGDGGELCVRNYRFLAANEQAIVRIRLHWVVLARVVLETVAVLVGVVALNIYAAAHGRGGGILITLLWWGALAAVLRLLWRMLTWYCTILLVTNSRFVKVSGIISLKVQSIPMSKITDLSYTLDPNGRVLGYGTFALETEGDHKSELEKLEYVPQPDQFYLLFCNSIFGGAPEPTTGD
ncbi:hypothetical protein CcI49_14460 [Frankia sp. CcI49]|nr:hypothetical protein FrEUN1fDRAFT_5045 [Parafrankia sp. EUN1f]KPM52382.1 hypothetical protein ACG83_28785 [Frankia sp. R43]ONH59915.1 hypothetical protein CcI49_14460 [Frankia sp. CcI49]